MQLNTQTFMWLLRAGVLTYGRSFDHPGSVYVVRGGPSEIEVRPVFMPAALPPGSWPEHAIERMEDMRRLRIAQALDHIAIAGALNAHTKLWLHARLNDLTTPQSAG